MPRGSYGGLQAHPLADAFPLMDGPAYEELKDRIGRNGLLHPITVYEGRILDGRNRKRACQDLGIACPEKVYTGDDPAGFVWDENAARRQLNAAQVAMAASKLESLGWGQRRDYAEASADASGPAPMTREEIAQRTGASPAGLDRAKRVRRQAVPEVVKAVEEGKLGLTAADRVSRKPKAEQERLMAETPVDQIGHVVPEERADRPRLVSVPTGFQAPDSPPEPVSRSRRPETRMARHMTLPEITFLRGVYKDWKEGAELIPGLDREKLYAFTDDLRKTKADLVRLIHLIEKTIEASNEESTT